jgi:NAD+ synthase (glutamine-hydrolysing)
MTQLHVALAQLNLTVGDLLGNLEKHRQALHEAKQKQIDIIIFPELSLTGYSPEDLLLRKDFLQAAEDTLQQFIADTKDSDIACFVGHPTLTAKGLYNACSCVRGGEVVACYFKHALPNYGVFDEKRYFVSGHDSCLVTHKGVQLGLIICEDAWQVSPAEAVRAQGAEILIVPNASPFETDKHARRLKAISSRAKENNLPVIYVNLVGGQDEVVFDGGSMIVNQEGMLCQWAGFFNETLFTATLDFSTREIVPTTSIHLPPPEKTIYEGLVQGVRDYVHKNHFEQVYIGVSGGIDSALVFAIALDALGPKYVHPVFMPSRYTAAISKEDVSALTLAAGVSYTTLSIEPAFQAFTTILSSVLKGSSPGATEENIQSRCRGVLLMALANKSNGLVLTTGNRSEIATGYCTLYGDMVGAFNPLKDVPKTLVYQLARYRNTVSPLIPGRILTRAPSAELKANQTDQDTLPPYDILDGILYQYLNRGKNESEIIEAGFDEKVVSQVVALVKNSEYKRHQTAPGTRINLKSFGKDWRYPITNGFASLSEITSGLKL